jgi:23S rRNA-/tRNA-specific pseudouridylate synthase
VVRATDPKTVADLLERIGFAARAALNDGRVFVDGRRISDPSFALRAGNTLALYRGPSGTSTPVTIIEERNGIILALKPASLPTEPDRRGYWSLRRAVSELVGCDESELHADSRLDFGVSGVVLLARGSAARHHLVWLRRQGKLVRRYFAIGGGQPRELRGTWMTEAAGDHRISKARYQVVAAVNRASQEAAVLLSIEPLTGRTHQLRIQAQAAGCPLYGDRAHGGSTRVTLNDGSVVEVRRVALHCQSVVLPDAHGSEWRVEAPVPLDLCALWEQLGGSSDAWRRAAEARFEAAHGSE